VCATASADKLEFALYFLKEIADLKTFDEDGAAFRNISLVFNKTVSTLRLMKEGLDVNIQYTVKETTSYIAVCHNTPQCITP
jgi:hypothetical protein